MLSRVKAGTQNASEIFFDKLGEDTFMTQQAFSEARLKIKDTSFSVLFYMTAALAYKDYYETWVRIQSLGHRWQQTHFTRCRSSRQYIRHIGFQFIIAHSSGINML